MFGRLLLLFLLVPILELALLIRLGAWIGLTPTLALILITAGVGSYLARREGIAAWHNFQTRLRTGVFPDRELADGLIILLSGVLLLTPGVMTDLLGLLGLIPISRTYLRKALLSWITTHSITSPGIKQPEDAASQGWQGAANPSPAYRKGTD